MSQKMHSNPQPHSQPMIDRPSSKQPSSATAEGTSAMIHTPSHQADSQQNGNKTKTHSIPNLSSVELVKLADTSADELMDAVFEDVDYMLDKGVSIVPERSIEQTTELTGQDSHTSSNLASAPSTQPPSFSQLSENTPESPQSFDEPVSPANVRQWGEAIGLAFPILGACATLGVALAAGLLLYGPNPALRPEVTPTASSTMENNADGVFADYMERALESIVAADGPNSDGGADSGNNGDASALTDTPEDGRQFADVPERVYIPVYQPPQPSLSALPTVPINGNLSPSPLVSSGIDTTPSESNPGAIAPVPLATTHPTTISPSTPSESTASNTTSSGSTASGATSANLSYDHVLVGLLQLGDRSVAMFDYAEGTHRVNVGEQIGTSGWSLVSVSETEAVIRRNGDVRSIYIGQSF